ncbi:MAG: hypothetical protein QMD22_03895 [archaeon]|nr:hypothetical protein [archaeon]
MAENTGRLAYILAGIIILAFLIGIYPQFATILRLLILALIIIATGIAILITRRES